MKKPTLMPLMALFVCLLFSCSSNTDELNENTTVEITIPETKIIEIEILELINNHRIGLGLNSLQNMDAVKGQAYLHTNYMISQNTVSHDNFGERSQYLKQNANAKLVSENVAYGYNSAESVVTAWLNSDSHREAIEKANFTHFDISAEKNENNQWYFTNIFIKK